MNKDIQEEIKRRLQEAEANISNMFISAENIFNKKLKEISKNICAAIVWVNEGAKTDNDQNRMVLQYLKGENICIDLLKLPLDQALKILTDCQAHLFWLYKGAKEDSDYTRMLDDYHDAKRYIGFLLAKNIIEGCKNHTVGDDCLKDLKKEYFEYLISLSVEEYVRILAYHRWEKMGKIIDDNTNRRLLDYYTSLECIQDTMCNCMLRNPQKYLEENRSCYVIKNKLLSINKEGLNGIKTAKSNAINRLRTISQDIDKYVNKFYELLKKAFKNNGSISVSDVEYLVQVLYRNNYVPNMLEFFLRCFLCTYITMGEHNEIRAKYKLPKVMTLP